MKSLLRPRVRFVPQMEMTECGAACLAMVMGFHGVNAGLAEVRERCEVSRDGTSAWSLIRAAQSYGFDAYAVRAEPVDLHNLPGPAILHWDFVHFVVLDRLARTGDAIIFDPAAGCLRVPADDVNRRFTGVAIILEPTVATKPAARTRVSLSSIRDLLRAGGGAFIQICLLSLLAESAVLLLPVALRFVLDSFRASATSRWLTAVGAVLIAIGIAELLLRLLKGWVSVRLHRFFSEQTQLRFARHLVRLPLQFFLRRRPGDLLFRLQSTASLSDLFASGSVLGVLGAFLVFGYLFIAIVTLPRFATVLLGFLASRIALELFVRPARMRTMASELVASSLEVNALAESFGTAETIRASDGEWQATERWWSFAVQRIYLVLRRRRFELNERTAASALMAASTVASLAYLVTTAMNGLVSVGVVSSLIVIQAGLATAVEGVMQSVMQVQHASTHLRRLDDVLDTEMEKEGETLADLTGSVTLEDLSFRYGEGQPLVLDHVNMAIRSGETVAIVGASGAGKSTLIQLILGLVGPSSGRVLLENGASQEASPGRRHSDVGAVLQEPFVLNGTVRRNLTFGDPRVPDLQLLRATQTACIDTFIQNLPRGLDTVLGEGGWQLSGGERQRLCLARALVREPSILLLDEPTSALDSDLEDRVWRKLKERGRTLIVVTHRLETLAHADRVIFLRAGHATEIHTPDELIQNSGGTWLVGGKVRWAAL